MRRLRFLALSAAVALALLAVVPGDTTPARATHGNFNVHVHDDYYHPVGAFIVGPGTDHTLAKASCQVANPDPQCDAVIHVGDTITWVAPSPLAANPHTVTECTDGSFSVCGPAVSLANPIGDSGVRNPPSPGPSGWPYGPVAFSAPGTYYYRCEVHPDVMRGRVVVLPLDVGGIVDIVSGDAGPASGRESGSGAFMWMAVAAAAGALAVALLSAGWYARRRWSR